MLKEFFNRFRATEPVPEVPTPHYGVDYETPPDMKAGIKEMQDAYAAFDALVLGVQKAAASTDALTKGAREEAERQAVLHRKAVERRRKRKRGGKK